MSLDGYNLIVRADGTDTKEGWCRGLLIYVKAGIMAARIESPLINSMVECEGVTVPWGNGGSVLSIVLAYIIGHLDIQAVRLIMVILTSCASYLAVSDHLLSSLVTLTTQE